MKTKSKALLLALCAVLLVAASVLGTMAYLTSQDQVTNTFTVGKIAITMDEANVDEYGTPIDGAIRVDNNAYKLIPGKTYVKDPEIHVAANSEDSYIFVRIQNGLAAYEAENNKIAQQILNKGWVAVPNTTDVFYKEYTKNSAVVDIEVFDSFTIATSCKQTDANWNDSIQPVVVTAYAIQKEAMTSVEGAWAIVYAEYSAQD